MFGSPPSVGDFLRQVAVREGQWVALLVWGAGGAQALQDRERWMGWNPALAAERLKLIVQNRRYLLLHEKGAEPNLASTALAAACRALPAQWQERFGYRPLLAESFTDPESYCGTCYKAGGWQPVGMSDGHSRHRADYFIPNGRPKRLWMKELEPGARPKAWNLLAIGAAGMTPAQFHAIDVHHARRLLHQALHEVVALRAPGAAVGAGRRGVGHHGEEVQVDRRDVVDAGRDPRPDQQLDRDAGAHRVGADVAERAHAHREHAAVGIEGRHRLHISQGAGLTQQFGQGLIEGPQRGPRLCHTNTSEW